MLSIGVVLISCDKYDEVHLEYIDEQEKIYSPIPENVLVSSGYKRLKFNSDFIYTTSLNKIVIDIDEQKLEFDLSLPESSETDTLFFEQTLENLTEGSKILKVYSVDTDNNLSLEKLYFGKVYGEKYQENLLNRNILEKTKDGDNCKIKFNTNPERAIRLELIYTKQDDSSDTLALRGTESEFEISDFKPGSEFSYRTFYHPDDLCLDTIPTAEAYTDTFPE